MQFTAKENILIGNILEQTLARIFINILSMNGYSYCLQRQGKEISKCKRKFRSQKDQRHDKNEKLFALKEGCNRLGENNVATQP